MPDFNTTHANLNKGFVVAIAIEAKEGEGDAIAKILEDLVAPTMAEKGVKFFIPYRSLNNPLSFFIYELYADEPAWVAHNNSVHFLSAVQELVPRCAKRERIPYIPYIK